MLLTGCQVRTEVGVDVNDDGSGTVGVSVGLDEDAMNQVPRVDDQLRLDDLRDTGWKVSGPEKDGNAITWWRATKAFAQPEDAAKVLAEVSGETGPFRGLRVERDRSFARTRFGFSGTLDLSRGLESFADEELAAALDGKPLGDDRTAFEQRIGQPLDQVFRFRVTVRLPGDITSSNAPTEASDSAAWQPALSDSTPTALQAESASWRVRSLAFAGIGLAALLALVVVTAVRVGRSRHTH